MIMVGFFPYLIRSMCTYMTSVTFVSEVNDVSHLCSLDSEHG